MTNLEWIRTLSAEELADWVYDEWLPRLQYRWSSSRGGLIIWLKDHKTENSSEKPNNCEVKNYCDDCLYTDTCDDKAFFYACTSKATISKMKQVEDEPMTDFANRLAYERGVKHAWEVAQKVFGSTVTFYEAEDVAKQIDKDINVRSKESE